MPCVSLSGLLTLYGGPESKLLTSSIESYLNLTLRLVLRQIRECKRRTKMTKVDTTYSMYDLICDCLKLRYGYNMLLILYTKNLKNRKDRYKNFYMNINT